MFSRFFIHRPIFAAVISIVIVIAGLVTLANLPVAQYPEITPPVVWVKALYPGANAKVLAETVAAPIEQQVNGVDGMLYMSSRCSNNGTYDLLVTFELGTDLDMASVLVQNRVAIAMPQLPEEVKRLGVTTEKQSTNIVQMITLTSPDDSFDQLYLSNYATLHLRDELARIDGVGGVVVYGADEYSMRLWLDPEKLRARGLTTNDVVAAIREQNVQVAAGQIGAPPAPAGQDFQYTINTLGRLSDVAQFEDIIIKTGQGGRITRVRDVARVEIGARSYSVMSRFNNNPSTAIAVYQSPGANALDLAQKIEAKMELLGAAFPQGLEYHIPFDTTRFVTASIHEVVETIVIAVILVFITLFVFLQDWRATLIPAAAIPVSLIGTFAVMGVLGFSVNMLTLFGIVLAIGIVVDDAIVVVENASRVMEERQVPAKEATLIAMQEITGPVVAITLVLMAVFIPTAFLGGITGELFRQFALTIATATFFSAVNALTLSPALCALVLRPGGSRHNFFFRAFNWTFDRGRNLYIRCVGGALRRSGIVMAIFVVLVAVTYLGFVRLPAGFLPQEDQGYAFVSAQLPDAASFERTLDVVGEINQILGSTEGIKDYVSVAGFSLRDFSRMPNAATFWVIFDPWEERKGPVLTQDAILGRLMQSFQQVQAAQVIAFAPPPIMGLGVSGGFTMMLQDQGDVGLTALEQTAQEMALDANAQTGLSRVYTTFRANVPQLYADIDRTRAKTLNVPLSEVFGTLQAYLGSAYVNDFNKFGRTYQVNIQAEPGFRDSADDIRRLEVRNTQGEMVPLGTMVSVEQSLGPQLITRYNMYPAAAINGQAAPGYSSGQALEFMEDMARSKLGPAMGIEWTDISFQEKAAGSGAVIFILAVLFVFLVLCAQYESWSIPFGVILAVPLALLGTVIGVATRAMDVNAYTQIGIVLLIALASKNAILIVEFAKEQRAAGKGIFEAAVEAARLRFRPILMTSFAFILGVLPLAVASGAGAASRQAVGTAVCSGMLAATFLTVLFVPVFYAVIQRISERFKRGKKSSGSTPDSHAMIAAREERISKAVRISPELW
jgi:hydrophobe/amphiphile efflux-1 (HAE1) family protein